MPTLFSRKTSYLQTQHERHALRSRIHLYSVYALIAVGVVLSVILFYKIATIDTELHIFIWSAIPFFIVVSVLLYVFSHHEKKSGQFKSGIEGERRVHEVLQQLSEEYVVYADGILGKGNLDFVVQKNTTLFNIEVKNHAGAISSNGVELLYNGTSFPNGNPLVQVSKSAEKLHNALITSVGHMDIVSLVVFSHPRTMVSVTGPVMGIHVVHVQALREFIEQY